MLLRARIIMPVGRATILNGAVRIRGHRIADLGRWPDMSGSARETVADLGESILLPGLVNAHCHLDYTDLAGHIAPPRSFTDWIQAMVALKKHWTYPDYLRSWQNGAHMLLRNGVTTVLDMECMPELVPAAWATTPLRVISFRELISFRTGKAAAETVQNALTEWRGLPKAGGRLGLSPHAPYTTTPDLLRAANRSARMLRRPLSIHVAESAEEFDMFMRGRGRLFDWLEPQRPMADCGQASPVSHLERCGALSQNCLAVHANYLAPGDAQLLARRKTSVVHCPRSHAYFAHAAFPYMDLAAAGVNVCLGTDSLVTVRKRRQQTVELNMFAEMQAFAAAFPEVSPDRIVRMCTINPAKALHREHEFGQLAPGAAADLIAIPFAGPAADAWSAVVHHHGDVPVAMIRGRWAMGQPGGKTGKRRARGHALAAR